MKILLSYLSDSNDTREFSTSIIPSGLFPLAVYLENHGQEVVIANFSHIGYKKAVARIEQIKPDIAGFSVLTHNRNDTFKLIRELKKKCPSIITVAGGVHVSALADDVQKRHSEIDHIIVGEGELGFNALLSRLGGIRKPPRVIETKRLDGNDEICMGVDFKGEMIGINANEQFKYIVPSRGSSDNGSFNCIPYTWGGSVVMRPPVSVADEMEKAHKRLGIIYFTIRDDDFSRNRSDMIELCREIRKRQFYPMWSCQMIPGAMDEELAIEMKTAGCERIYLVAESGSDTMLQTLLPGVDIAAIESCCKATRHTGLYLTLLLKVGLFDEKHSDILKTVALLKKTLPGEMIVSPAVYYPGTIVYKSAIESGRISGSSMFEGKDKSLYLRSDMDIRSWIEEVRSASRTLRAKSWYREKDFREHRKVIENCWVTDVLEGDFHLDEEHEKIAEHCYLNIVSEHPLNPWGYLRLGKLSFRTARFSAAEHHYAKVTELLPQYFGGWLKLAESRIAQGKKREGKEAIAKAYDLNKWDIRVMRLFKSL